MPEEELWSRPVEEQEQLWSRPVEYGESPNQPVDTSHPDITVGMRQLINWSGGDPQTAVRYLQGKGYEAKALDGFNFAVRKPGEPKWQRLDSSKWEFQDVLDVLGDVFSLGGIVGGGLVTAPGLATSIGGAALGGAGAQGVRSGIGQMLGMPATGGEVAKSMGAEALMGAGAEVGGRLIGGAVGKVARKLRGKPPPKAPAPAKVDPNAATESEMLAAIKAAGPDEPMKLTYPATGEIAVTKGVPFDQKVWDHARRQAKRDLGKTASADALQAKALTVYKKLVEGRKPTPGAGQFDPMVGVKTREAQIAKGGFTDITEVEGKVIVPRTFADSKGSVAIKSTAEIEKVLADPSTPFWVSNALKAALKEGSPGLAKWASQVAERLDAVVYIGKGPAELFMKSPGMPAWAKGLLKKGLQKDPVDAAAGAEQIAQLLKGALKSPGAARAGVPRQIVSPAGISFTPEIPTGSEIIFWKLLNKFGIQKLEIGGRVMVLTEAQEKAAKVVVQSIATGTWTPTAKKLLKGLIAGLKWPRARIIDALEIMTNRHVGKYARKHPILSNIGLSAVEGVVSGTMGGVSGLAAVGDVAGRGLSKVFKNLLGDTSGKALRGVLSRATLGAPEALKRAAQAAGAGNAELYRSIMWSALQATDVNEYLQQVMGSRGVNASGPRVRQGHGS